jgi:hypothetical protein
MVIRESFVTRKPLEFTLLVLFLIFLILLPVYFYTKNRAENAVVQPEMLSESYQEVASLFSPESDLSDSDKRHLFNFKYENSVVQWDGDILGCDAMTDMYRVRVDETGDDVGEVLFTTVDDCMTIPSGSHISFKMKIVDWTVTRFIGADGEILTWG